MERHRICVLANYGFWVDIIPAICFRALFLISFLLLFCLHNKRESQPSIKEYFASAIDVKIAIQLYIRKPKLSEWTVIIVRALHRTRLYVNDSFVWPNKFLTGNFENSHTRTCTLLVSTACLVRFSCRGFWRKHLRYDVLHSHYRLIFDRQIANSI